MRRRLTEQEREKLRAEADARYRAGKYVTYEEFVAKLRSKYPPGQSSDSMTAAVEATAERRASGCEFKTGEEMGLRKP